MTDFVRQYGQWGVIVGAAEGLGEAFSEILAARGMNLIMVDVKAAEMKSLAAKLEARYGIMTKQIETDLSRSESVEHCLKYIRKEDCRLMVYNAAYSRIKAFLLADREELDLYININTRTPLQLAYGFGNHLKKLNQKGGILLMSSLAGLWGTKLIAAYSGTKAFNLALAEALHHEFKSQGIAVSACCTGPVATPAYLATKPDYGLIKPKVLNPKNVASYAIDKLGKKAILIPGFSNRVNYLILTRILPRKISSAIVNKTMGRAYRSGTA